MGSYAKWIGSGLGWAVGGPIGALLGFVIGSVVDGAGMTVKQLPLNTMRTTSGGYITSLLVLVAAVMKADGKVMRSELDYVKEFLRRNFGEDAAADSAVLLKDLLEQNIPLADVCRQIETHMHYSARLQLLHFLYGIAFADSRISPEEEKLIGFIGVHLGIKAGDLDSIRAMFIRDTGYAYTILEIESSATDEEVKKAWRRMAMKYHPDKLATMGEEIQKAAHEKFSQVNEAYETIKKERNLI
jgi:DnaJ like chaperone protein